MPQAYSKAITRKSRRRIRTHRAMATRPTARDRKLQNVIEALQEHRHSIDLAKWGSQPNGLHTMVEAGVRAVFVAVLDSQIRSVDTILNLAMET